jgi:hypothetical protein
MAPALVHPLSVETVEPAPRQPFQGRPLHTPGAGAAEIKILAQDLELAAQAAAATQEVAAAQQAQPTQAEAEAEAC